MSTRTGPGRPPVPERRTQILDAFIELLAEHGLEAVSLDDVARAAGVQRSMIRHFVGNRADLIRGAAEELAERYARLVRAQLGDDPTLAEAIDHLFSDRWVGGMATEDAALAQLLREAAHDEPTRERIKAMYDQLVASLAAGIRREHPTVTTSASRDLAYTIVCAAEHNVAMRGLGFPASRSLGAARTVHELIAGLPD
jgi:AcrR family transcriptional regulator